MSSLIRKVHIFLHIFFIILLLQDYTINYLLNHDVTSEKIVLGIPTYGRSYTLYNAESTDIGAPADGPGEEGDATREKGYLAYYEVSDSTRKNMDFSCSRTIRLFFC